jgi:hypothetical protein
MCRVSATRLSIYNFERLPENSTQNLKKYSKLKKIKVRRDHFYGSLK